MKSKIASYSSDALGRTSALAHVRLSDGRLAWPVARAAGMSEPTFRARLRAGLSPDDAVSKPVAKRGPSHAPDRAQWAAQRAADLAAQSADGYSGVIWQDGDCRLIVSPGGATYVVQVLCPDGSWQVDQEFPSAGFLRHWLFMAAIDPSPALVKTAAGLPDDPASSGFVADPRSASFVD